MPASLRLIKILKDTITGREDDYTIETEIMADDAKNLMKEIVASPFGERICQLIDRAQFLPEASPKTAEEMKAEAEEEAKRIKDHEEGIITHAKNERDYEWKRFLRKEVGHEQAEILINKWEQVRKLEQKQPSEE